MPHKRSLVALAALIPLLGCGSPSEPEPGPLSVAISMSQSEVVPGDSMTVTVSATNVTDSSVAARGSSSCWLRFEVRDALGRYVAPQLFCTDDLAGGGVIPPGETRELSFAWTAENRRLTTGDSVPLPAGSYRVHGVLDGVDLEARTAPLALRVVDP